MYSEQSEVKFSRNCDVISSHMTVHNLKNVGAAGEQSKRHLLKWAQPYILFLNKLWLHSHTIQHHDATLQAGDEETFRDDGPSMDSKQEQKNPVSYSDFFKLRINVPIKGTHAKCTNLHILLEEKSNKDPNINLYLKEQGCFH